MALRKKTRSGQASLTDRRLAYLLLDRTELIDVRLLNAMVADRLPLGQKPKFLKIELLSKCDIGHATSKKTGVDSLQLRVIATFNVLAVPAEDTLGPDGALELKFTYLLIYSLSSDDGVNEDMLHAFTKWIGFNNIWPYAREFIHNTSARMGHPHLRLPLYKPGIVTPVNE